MLTSHLHLLGSILGLALLLARPAAVTAQTASDKARELVKERQYAAALEKIAAARKELPAQALMAAWRFPHPYPRSLRSALPGAGRHYLVYSESGERVMALGAGDKRPVLNDTTMRYDFQERIVCVDTTSGKLLWTRLTMGRMGLGVEPGTDDLFVWRNRKVMKLSAKSGEVIFDKDVVLKQFDRLDGVIAGGHHLIRRPRGFDDDQREFREALLYNVATGEAGHTDVIFPPRLAPDEKSVLRLSTTWVGQRYGRTIHLIRPDRKTQAWEYFHGGYSYNDPFWHKEDVIALNGDRDTKSEVVRLQGETGKIVWRFGLPRGAWRSTHWEHRHGAYPHLFQDAIALLGNRLLAIGGEGALYFLDPATGKLEAKASLGGEHFLFPTLVGDQLIVCTSDELRSVPLRMVLGQSSPDERDLAVLAAECLAKTGQIPQAFKELDAVLHDFPEFQPAWAARVDLCRLDKRSWQEVEARCRVLELTGKETDPVLHEKFGLVKRIATGQNLRTSLVRLQDSLFFGTEAGFVFELDTRSLDIVEKKEQPAAVLSLTPTGKLKAHFDDRSAGDVAEFPGESAIKRIADRHNGALGGEVPVRWRGKQYLALKGGHVRVISPRGEEEHRTKLEGVTHWNIHFGPAGPLGYGGGGVFALDDNLCPIRHLVKLEPWERQKGPRSPTWLASDRTTFAYGLADGEAGGEIHVRSLDGKKALKAVNYRGAVRRSRGESVRLSSCGDGYLFAGQELVWAPATDVGHPWRFSVGDFEPDVRKAEDAFHFYTAVSAGPHTFATASDGAVYVFDVAKLGK
jgi:outer membrane protein assembly factor BamB